MAKTKSAQVREKKKKKKEDRRRKAAGADTFAHRFFTQKVKGNK